LTTEERLSDIVGKQASTKYETVLNIKTAKALGLEVSAECVAHADEVIE